MGYTGPGLLAPLCKSWDIDIFDRVTSVTAVRLKEVPPETLLRFKRLEKLSIATVESEKVEGLLASHFNQKNFQPQNESITIWTR